MNPLNPTPEPITVGELFRALLANKTSTTSHQYLSPSTTPEPLKAPPAKNSIRFIENDQNNRREKYDGCRWRLVCTWNEYLCTNIAYTNQLCAKHNAIKRNKIIIPRKRKPLVSHSSLPIMKKCNHQNFRFNDDDDDIQILEDYCKSPTIRRSMNSNIKSEMPDFHVFSVEHACNTVSSNNIKSEPTSSSSKYRSATSTNDVEYLTSKTRSNGLNLEELLSKNLPPLTEFEEEFLATRLIQQFSTNSSMLDAQLFIHNEAIAVVKQNYRLKMDSIAPEYFYDFLLRHPRVALHYSNWFLRCKPVPPSTGCAIDTKIWTLSMIVRGATATDNMTDECNE